MMFSQIHLVDIIFLGPARLTHDLTMHHLQLDAMRQLIAALHDTISSQAPLWDKELKGF